MQYYELHRYLSDAIHEEIDKVLPDIGMRIKWNEFESDGVSILPGIEKYVCEEHDVEFSEADVLKEQEVYNATLEEVDSSIKDNAIFKYPVITCNDNTNGVIILLHGLNEKKWDKYMPWAYTLAKKTGKAIVLFPIAFHMNRAPEGWSDPRDMALVADCRRQNKNLYTSFVNAAISTRLEQHPQRFFWSGLQTYMDVIKLTKHLKKGEIEGVPANDDIDFFAYSIGVFFTLILLMADDERLHTNSKLFGFCGGTTMDRMYPSSRYILDYNASQSLHDYFAKMVNANFSGEERLAHYMGDLHKGVSYFKTMLLYHHFIDEREQRLKEIADRISVLALKKDTIIPPVEVLNTLTGRFRDIKTSVTIADYNFPYSHITPFSTSFRHAAEVDAAFDEFMTNASNFLS